MPESSHFDGSQWSSSQLNAAPQHTEQPREKRDRLETPSLKTRLRKAFYGAAVAVATLTLGSIPGSADRQQLGPGALEILPTGVTESVGQGEGSVGSFSQPKISGELKSNHQNEPTESDEAIELNEPTESSEPRGINKLKSEFSDWEAIASRSLGLSVFEGSDEHVSKDAETIFAELENYPIINFPQSDAVAERNSNLPEEDRSGGQAAVGIAQVEIKKEGGISMLVVTFGDSVFKYNIHQGQNDFEPMYETKSDLQSTDLYSLYVWADMCKNSENLTVSTPMLLITDENGDAHLSVASTKFAAELISEYLTHVEGSYGMAASSIESQLENNVFFQVLLGTGLIFDKEEFVESLRRQGVQAYDEDLSILMNAVEMIIKLENRSFQFAFSTDQDGETKYQAVGVDRSKPQAVKP